MLNELKTAITAYIRNISQADLQKVFVNKIKRVQACIGACGHHFQHLLEVHSDFLNALYIIKDITNGVFNYGFLSFILNVYALCIIYVYHHICKCLVLPLTVTLNSLVMAQPMCT
jgi:hypothetical protein